MLFTQLFIFIRSTKESRSSCPIKSKMSLNFTYVTVSLFYYQPLSILRSGIHGPPDRLAVSSSVCAYHTAKGVFGVAPSLISTILQLNR